MVELKVHPINLELFLQNSAPIVGKGLVSGEGSEEGCGIFFSIL